MPPEIQAMIWAEKMQKPGLHVLNVQVPLKGSPNKNNDEGVRKIKLTKPCHIWSPVLLPGRFGHQSVSDVKDITHELRLRSGPTSLAGYRRMTLLVWCFEG
jgi:hypothetical protein